MVHSLHHNNQQLTKNTRETEGGIQQTISLTAWCRPFGLFPLERWWVPAWQLCNTKHTNNIAANTDENNEAAGTS